MAQSYLVGLSSTSLFVSFYLYFPDTNRLTTVRASWRIIGTPTILCPPVVRFPFSVFLSAASHRCILDSPEIGPSTVIGASSTLPASPSASNRPSSSQPSGAVPLLIVTSTSFPDIPYEYPPTSSPSISSTSNTGAIVGGVIGGIALVGIIIVCIVYTRRRRNGSPPYAASSACAVPPAPFVVDVSPQSPIEHEGKKALSDDGTLVSSIMPDSPVSPTRVYVRVFVPLSH